MTMIQVHVKAHRVPEHMVRAHNVKAYTYTRKVKAPASKAPARKVKAPMRKKVAMRKKAPAPKKKKIGNDLTQEEKDYWGL